MAEGNYGSIGPLDATAQKEAMPIIGLIALDMVAVVVGIYIAGAILNSL